LLASISRARAQPAQMPENGAIPVNTSPNPGPISCCNHLTSRNRPTGWTLQSPLLRRLSSNLVGKGKKPSDATYKSLASTGAANPHRAAMFLRLAGRESANCPTRLILSLHPSPLLRRSFTYTIAFGLTCFATFHARADPQVRTSDGATLVHQLSESSGRDMPVNPCPATRNPTRDLTPMVTPLGRISPDPA